LIAHDDRFGYQANHFQVMFSTGGLSHKDGLHLDGVQMIKAEIEVALIEQQQNFDFAQLKAELGLEVHGPMAVRVPARDWVRKGSIAVDHFHSMAFSHRFLLTGFMYM
jgi:hypothetical protein